MNFPISELSADSRIWIFAASADIDKTISANLLDDTSVFLENWLAHQKTLKASALFLHQQFLVIAVDENHNDASGCSIDKLHHFIKTEENKLHINLLDRMRVAFRSENQIKNISLQELQAKINAGEINAETIIFDPLVDTLDAFNTSFETPLKNTWLNRYLSKQQA